jgi:hypothetical protein
MRAANAKAIEIFVASDVRGISFESEVRRGTRQPLCSVFTSPRITVPRAP